MSNIKTEGCAWHWQLDDEAPEASASGTHTQAFARLMRQGAPAAGEGGAMPFIARNANARYRLVGGSADGLICDISDGPDGLQMLVIVLETDLYHQLCAVAPRLSAVLRKAGYRMSLEVSRAEPDA
ncbi:hypothetical protein SGGMMB4_02914 [Sodalis glossinidius str. 'morsitans']|uniref:Type III secretion apparatus n=1 Tax=Sodalis glossinidius (strain morsitans) TaxID=343509 RepID=Q2NTE7_SODGM|nr:type III secretion apparatus [Sodalis glossinidius]BAE74578.1 putative type III secretion apparatus [Sodalis glossinidius str. 'morsitans']CRL45299.1 hypothetical protein SGGMMB4_02914 [Sodalis glossinidius str. 'morsitans']